MEEWKEYRLGDICQTNKEQYSKKDNFNNVIYLDTGNITENTIHELQYITIGTDKLPSRARRKVNNNDIIFSNVRPIQLHYGILRNPPKNMLVSTGFTVITSNDDLCNAQFLYHFITQKEIVEHLQSIGEQAVSTYPTIKSSDIENLKICLPSLPTQQKIANILSSLDDKIEVNRRINEQLEELAQALFKSWFVDFEPFKDGEFVESELGMIPEGWKVGTLGNVADVVMGASPAGSSYNTEGNGSIFYQGRTDFGFRFPNVRMYTTEPKRFAESNSVLLSVRAPVGDVNIAFEKCCIGRGLASIKSNSNADSYTYYLMKSLKPVLDNYNNEGTVFGCINKDALNNLSIVVPTIEIIKEFERIVSCSDMEIRRRSEEITHLTNLRDTLLPKLMSGEIDVDQLNVIG